MASPKMLILSAKEVSYLSEAIRYNQEAREEDSGRLDPTLSRIQRKLGEEPHS